MQTASKCKDMKESLYERARSVESCTPKEAPSRINVILAVPWQKWHLEWLLGIFTRQQPTIINGRYVSTIEIVNEQTEQAGSQSFAKKIDVPVRMAPHLTRSAITQWQHKVYCCLTKYSSIKQMQHILRQFQSSYPVARNIDKYSQRRSARQHKSRCCIPFSNRHIATLFLEQFCLRLRNVCYVALGTIVVESLFWSIKGYLFSDQMIGYQIKNSKTSWMIVRIVKLSHFWLRSGQIWKRYYLQALYTSPMDQTARFSTIRHHSAASYAQPPSCTYMSMPITSI
jgi:hypothetical protein